MAMRLVFTVLVLVPMLVPVPGPGIAVAAAQVPSFPSTTELVYVRFHVDRKGAPVGELRKDQVRVLEDGRPQELVVLETPATRERTVFPEVTLALDVSSSVMDPGLLDESLIRQLLASLPRQARVGLCAFGGRLECPTAPTTDAAGLLAGFQEALQLGRTTRGEGTRLYGSLAEISRREPEGGQAQRAVIVFTDGLDTRGGKVEDAMDAAQAADVRVYAVKLSQGFQATARDNRPSGGFGGGGFGGGGPNRAMYDYKKLELDRLAEVSGGQTYEPGSLDDRTLREVLRRIATEISTEIVAGYAPEGPPTGKKRKVKVELVDKSVGKVRDGERTLVR
ncbi:MAG TPA: VWA domain-containing protein [Vicinamibacteria bacterium]|nr:VWA domain-containing protein [Vicinamibacteria bacterium]